MRAELLALALLLPACVTTGSAYRASSQLARERSGFEADFHPIDADGAIDPEEQRRLDGSIRRLLGAPLGPNEAIRIALARSPSLQASFESLGVARADLLGASLPPNLEFDLEARLGRADSQAGDELEAHVVIDVTDLITLPLRRAAAMAEVEAAQIDAAEAVLDVAFRVRSAFVDYVAALRLRDAMQDVVRATSAASALSTAMLEVGNVPRLDAVTQQATYEESRLWLAEAELEVLESRERLSTTMGLQGEETAFEVSLRLDDPAPDEVDLERLEARTIERNLHLSASRFELLAIARRQGVARLDGVLPQLRAGVSGSIADGETAYGPAISVGVPLWNQGQGLTRRYEAELRVGLRRFEADAIEVRSSVRRARNRLLSARERVLFLRDTLVPLRTNVLEETVLQYDAMQASPFQVLSARRDQVEATRTYLRTLREYWRSRAALVHLLAGGRVSFDADADDATNEEAR